MMYAETAETNKPLRRTAEIFIIEIDFELDGFFDWVIGRLML